MGTRHITAVVSEGQFVVAQYGQWVSIGLDNIIKNQQGIFRKVFK